MGILVSLLCHAADWRSAGHPLWNWRACYAFPAGVPLRWRVTFQHGALDAGNPLPPAPRTRLIASYKTLFGNGAFNCYLLMLIGGLAFWHCGLFEACSGVLMGAVLGLCSSMR